MGSALHLLDPHRMFTSARPRPQPCVSVHRCGVFKNGTFIWSEWQQFWLNSLNGVLPKNWQKAQKTQPKLVDCPKQQFSAFSLQTLWSMKVWVELVQLLKYPWLALSPVSRHQILHQSHPQTDHPCLWLLPQLWVPLLSSSFPLWLLFLESVQWICVAKYAIFSTLEQHGSNITWTIIKVTWCVYDKDHECTPNY